MLIEAAGSTQHGRPIESRTRRPAGKEKKGGSQGGGTGKGGRERKGKKEEGEEGEERADSVHSTPPTNTSANNIVDPSRRGFLVQAAVVAAGGAAIGMSLPLPVSAGGAERVPDPIHAAIEAHKAVYADFWRAIDALCALERGIMAKGSRLSRERDEDPVVGERKRCRKHRMSRWMPLVRWLRFAPRRWPG